MQRSLALLCVACLGGFALADTTPVSVTLDNAFLNKYLWRGVNFANGAVYQPTLTFGLNGWALCFWGNYELTNTNGTRGRFDEIDTDLSYTASTEGATWTVGFVNYSFPNTGASDTSEVYGKYTWSQDWSPTVAAYFDVDEAEGFYVSVAANRTMEGLTLGGGMPTVDFNYGASIGFGNEKHNDFYYGNRDSALADWKAFGTFSFPASQDGTFYVTTAVTGLFDSAHLRGARNRSNFVFGAGYTLKF